VVRLTPAGVNADFEAAWATAIRAVSALVDMGAG